MRLQLGWLCSLKVINVASSQWLYTFCTHKRRRQLISLPSLLNSWFDIWLQIVCCTWYKNYRLSDVSQKLKCAEVCVFLQACLYRHKDFQLKLSTTSVIFMLSLLVWQSGERSCVFRCVKLIESKRWTGILMCDAWDVAWFHFTFFI